MGCASSAVGAETRGGNQDARPQNVDRSVALKETRHRRQDVTEIQHAKRLDGVDDNANTLKIMKNPVPKPVAFDLSLDGQNTELLFARRPRRLQTLDPLDVPRLSAEMLAEKQRQAEEKREKMRQKRASASKKSSKRRQELMQAKEFEMKQQVQQEKILDEQQKLVEQKREAKLKEIQERQRIREERARRARERARKLNQAEQEDIEVEKDEEFNASDNDSWLGNEDRDSGETMHSGEASPKKRVQGRDSGVCQTASASTVDSYDAAFQRQPSGRRATNTEHSDDEFFD